MMQTRRILPAWLAIVALALHALWPLVAQARPKMPGMLVHVCTMDGVSHFVDLTPDGSLLEKRSASQHEHCKMCVFGSDRVAVLPPAVVPALIIPAASTDAPALPAVATPDTSSYPPAYPRAPPVVS